MTVSISREGWNKAYIELRQPNGFLTRQFTVKPGGIFKGEKITMDIQRFGEDVAVAIEKCTGPNENDISVFSTKEFTPPSYGESFPLDVCELLNRMTGVDPYSAEGIQYGAQLSAKMAQGFALIDAKISRAVELQASQILQTGILTLTDGNGATVYTLSFLPKATHFPTVSNDWGQAGETPYDDLLSLANVIRGDGKVNPDQLFFGEGALSNFLDNTKIQTQLDNLRVNIGEIRPEFNDSGATFYGYVWIGTYRFEIWAYPETFTDPQTGNTTKYIDDNKVIMKSSRTRLDMTSAMVPLPLGPDPRVAGLMPGRMSSREAGFDVTPNVYPTPNGKQIRGELESRTLLIPAQIDGFGCLNTIQ